MHVFGCEKGLEGKAAMITRRNTCCLQQYTVTDTQRPLMDPVGG